MVREILVDAELRMRGSISALESDLQTFRTGVASPQWCMVRCCR
jgi:ribosome recycling factor